jgi:hypothetical protein
MMKTSKNSSSVNQPRKLFIVLLVITLILLILLFFLAQKQFHPSAKINTATPSVYFTPLPVRTVIPLSLTDTALAGTESVWQTESAEASFRETATASIVAANLPPVCTFPLPQTTVTESTPENYVFAEPKVIANTSDSIDIYEWLPDSQRALITRDHLTPDNNYIAYQSIELLNTETGKTQVYATRVSHGGSLIWLAGLSAVVYPDTVYLSSDAYNNNGTMIVPTPYAFQRQLWLSRGDPAHTQAIEDSQLTLQGGGRFDVIRNSDGSEIAYWDEFSKNLYLRKVSQSSLEIVPLSFDLTTDPMDTDLNIDWRPNSDQIFFHRPFGQWGIYAYLLNTTNGEACRIKLLYTNAAPTTFNDGVLMSAQWSSDGRYLAAVTTLDPEHGPYTLTVLDSATGKLTKIDASKFNPLGIQANGHYYISAVAWAPDNRHLLVIVDYSNLYLFDFVTSQVEPILPAEQFLLGNTSGTYLAWSPDGSKILAECQSSGLCVIPVQSTGQ